MLKRSISMLLSEDKTHRYAAAQDSLLWLKGKVSKRASMAMRKRK